MVHDLLTSVGLMWFINISKLLWFTNIGLNFLLSVNRTNICNSEGFPVIGKCDLPPQGQYHNSICRYREIILIYLYYLRVIHAVYFPISVNPITNIGRSKLFFHIGKCGDLLIPVSGNHFWFTDIEKRNFRYQEIGAYNNHIILTWMSITGTTISKVCLCLQFFMGCRTFILYFLISVIRISDVGISI